MRYIYVAGGLLLAGVLLLLIRWALRRPLLLVGGNAATFRYAFITIVIHGLIGWGVCFATLLAPVIMLLDRSVTSPLAYRAAATGGLIGGIGFGLLMWTIALLCQFYRTNKSPDA